MSFIQCCGSEPIWFPDPDLESAKHLSKTFLSMSDSYSNPDPEFEKPDTVQNGRIHNTDFIHLHEPRSKLMSPPLYPDSSSFNFLSALLLNWIIKFLLLAWELIHCTIYCYNLTIRGGHMGNTNEISMIFVKFLVFRKNIFLRNLEIK